MSEALSIDTHATFKNMVDAGFTEEQAEAVLESVVAKVATKEDLEGLASKAEIKSLELQIANAMKETAKITKETAQIRENIVELTKETAQIRENIAKIERETAEIRQKVAEIEAKLGKVESNLVRWMAVFWVATITAMLAIAGLMAAYNSPAAN